MKVPALDRACLKLKKFDCGRTFRATCIASQLHLVSANGNYKDHEKGKSKTSKEIIRVSNSAMLIGFRDVARPLSEALGESKCSGSYAETKQRTGQYLIAWVG